MCHVILEQPSYSFLVSDSCRVTHHCLSTAKLVSWLDPAFTYYPFKSSACCRSSQFNMQSMQRKFGRMTTKRSADDSQVAVLMKDFEDADTLLTKVGTSIVSQCSSMLILQVIESTRAWRDAWISIATFQSRVTDEFDGLYAPIIGSSETTSPHKPVETDPVVLSRTNRLRREYDELRGDLVEELNAVEERMTRPAENAKESIVPMKKTIKKRNDKKVRRALEQCWL